MNKQNLSFFRSQSPEIISEWHNRR